MEDNENYFTDLEFFCKKRYRSCKPFVTIRKNNILYFSKGFIEIHIKEFEVCKYVIFSYSKIKNAIIFELLPSKDRKGAMKITEHKNSKSLPINRFLIYFGIKNKFVLKKYIPKKENINCKRKAFVIYLEEKQKRSK